MNVNKPFSTFTDRVASGLDDHSRSYCNRHSGYINGSYISSHQALHTRSRSCPSVPEFNALPMHSLHTSASYGDFDAKSSTVSGSSYMRGNRSDHSLPLSEQDRKRKRRPREDDAPTSSGYNSYSEMSEFANTSRSSKQRKSTNSLTLNDKHHSDIDDDKYLKIPRNSSSGRLDDSNHLRVPKQSKTSLHSRSDSKLSMSGSEPSTKVSSSGVRKKKTDKSSPHKCSHNEKISTPTIGNVSVTVNNNVNYDPNDPFSFIQPVEIPFYAKVRKCLGPLAAVLLVVVLAGALGAAIYFASALKETQEKQIDILRANLAVRIRTIDSIENIDDLSGSQLRDLSMDHCTQMDRFYAASSFRNTYRGCEVVSIKNHSINFTLFFAEKEATTTQIIGVIETSADKKPDAKPELTVVGKLSLELNNAEITMDRRMEPETFDKKTGIIVITTTTLKPADKAETTTPQPTAQASPVAPPIGVSTPASAGILKPQPSDLRVYSWDPCASFNGSYFPHPTECDQFFQCSNGASILQNCTAGLLYHWNKTTCVSRFMLGVSEQCPDAKRAPPKPMPTTPSTTTSTTPSTTTSTTMPQRPTKQITKTTTNTLATTKTTNKPAMTVNFFTGPSTMDPFLADFLDHNAETTHGPNANALILTAIAALSLHRPKYSKTPCSGNDVQLYPYPDDCAKFIQCVNKKPQIRNCSHGLVFDSAINACIIPPNKELLCPDIKPCSTTKEGYFSHPFDCTKFIQCDRNKEIVRSCPPGFYWDEEINACLTQKPKRKCYSNLPQSTI
ncbi:uncharacterized protein LOC127834334 [Dreissena polymorpha]|uniref:uncharacterized protein LOC127834334 n=1 Tax=Dreissena polymorpha TaxID=45954 RepID=UPI0022655362|nr:uncharacterized protein LOC127834334 [Dreissena polymorpha]